MNRGFKSKNQRAPQLAIHYRVPWLIVHAQRDRSRHLARSRNEYFQICLSIGANFCLDIFKSTLMCRLSSTSQNRRAREVSGLTGLDTRIS
jgi:hypothetical protein